jgi:hypothetical protein
MAATLQKAEGWAEQVLPLFAGDLHSELWFSFALYASRRTINISLAQ